MFALGKRENLVQKTLSWCSLLPGVTVTSSAALPGRREGQRFWFLRKGFCRVCTLRNWEMMFTEALNIFRQSSCPGPAKNMRFRWPLDLCNFSALSWRLHRPGALQALAATGIQIPSCRNLF